MGRRLVAEERGERANDAKNHRVFQWRIVLRQFRRDIYRERPRFSSDYQRGDFRTQFPIRKYVSRDYRSTPDDSVGRATGLSGVSAGLTSLLFPLLTGFLVDSGSYKSISMIADFMPLLGTIALFALARPYRRVSF